MSNKEVSKTQEETEVMQVTGIPAQETEGVSVVLATEIITDLKRQLEEAKEEADNLEHMVLQMQWIAIAYAAIRQSLFLKWSLDADGISAEEALDYETVREYMVVISRMTGYEDEDIRGYLENSFAELIWDWGYFALII